jgi:hypothetical protein
MQSDKAVTQATVWFGQPGLPQLVVAVCVAALGLEVVGAAFAQTKSTLSGGPPVQVVPYVTEPGVPAFTTTPGTANPFSGADGSGSDGSTGAGGAAATPGALGPLPDITGPTSASTAVSGQGTTLTYTNADGTTTTLSGGSAAWRDNNPGNLVYNSYTQSLGAIGSNGNFAVFPDVATGTAALTALLNGPTYQALSVNDAIARYAPAFENNTSAYQAFVTNSLGASGSTTLSSLSQSQMQTLQSAIQHQEGYTAGTAS